MLDFIAGGLELIGAHAIGNKKRYAFLVGIVCDLLWIQVGISARLYGLVTIASLALVMNIRNFVKWRGTEKLLSKGVGKALRAEMKFREEHPELYGTIPPEQLAILDEIE